MFFLMSTLKFNAVKYCWYICDDYMRANEFMSYLSFVCFVRTIMSEIYIFGSLLDMKRCVETVKKHLMRLIKCNS